MDASSHGAQGSMPALRPALAAYRMGTRLRVLAPAPEGGWHPFPPPRPALHLAGEWDPGRRLASPASMPIPDRGQRAAPDGAPDGGPRRLPAGLGASTLWPAWQRS
jgi:hypothetical protein